MHLFVSHLAVFIIGMITHYLVRAPLIETKEIVKIVESERKSHEKITYRYKKKTEKATETLDIVDYFSDEEKVQEATEFVQKKVLTPKYILGISADPHLKLFQISLSRQVLDFPIYATFSMQTNKQILLGLSYSF